MQLSIIVLNYNVRFHLQLCLLSVQRAIQHLDAEIIVVDNASTDTSLQMLKGCFPELKVIPNKENLGFSKANNIGVAAARGEYVCILNPDTVLPEDCFERLLNHIAVIEKLGAVGIRLIDGTGNFLPESKRNVPTPRVALAKLLKRSKLYYANHLKEDEDGKVEVLVGAFMMLKRKVYQELGGFDEDYFMYGEDIDLSYRLLQAGYNNYYCGSVHAIHFKGESTLRNKIYAKRFYDAMRIFYEKHFSTTALEKQMVGLTLNAAKSLKTLSHFNKSENKRSPAPIMISSKDKLFIEKLKNKLLLPIGFTEQLPSAQVKTKDKMFILDAGSFSFTDIIACMQTCSKTRMSFRIRPPDCNYILGSDSSTRQGKVIFLED